MFLYNIEYVYKDSKNRRRHNARRVYADTVEEAIKRSGLVEVTIKTIWMKIR